MIKFSVPAFILLCCFLQFPSFTVARQLHVGDNQSFHTIREGITASAPSDTIIVHRGTYKEHHLMIKKSVTLIARDDVVVDAGGKAANIFVVIADSVRIENFELTNVGVSFLKEIAAVRLRNTSGAKIRNNRITNCFFGIYLQKSSHSKVSGNQILGKFEDEASAGNAIHAWKSDHLRITGNTLTGHRDGIYLEFVDDSFIEQNNSRNNLRYGLHFMFSNRDAYRRNTFRNNGAGVAVMFSKHIKMTNNTFVHNWGGAAYGLLLKEISDGKIAGNRFLKNTIGIMAEGANRLNISGNQFTNNGTAMDMKGNCLDNRIIANNFLANTFEVVTNSSRNTNTYRKNYWSGYKGYDLNKDGIGDVPYRPVNLFAKITNKIPSATIMLHSPVVSLLEMSEKIFPRLIPEELIDKAPKMRPYAYD